MKKAFLLLGVICMALFAGQAQNSLVLQPDSAATKINKEIYGHFAEHLGRCIYGGIYVVDTSGIPNINGYRMDVVDALKDMQIPVLRWPGGCFADTYHWKDGIGPKEDRPSIVNVFWGGVTEDNSFGTHEFLNLCELLGTEPYISLNVGSGTVQEAAEWVEYVTSDNISPMTDLRKKNGREKAWDVKYWGIGNESWGCGGDMRPEYYADLFRRYASYSKGAPFKIACGANSFDYNWTETVMERTRNKQNLMQGISLHYYTLPYNWRHKGSATDFNEKEWFTTLSKTLQMQDLIDRHGAIMDKYDPRGRVGLMVDEWGSWYDVEPGTNPGFLYQQNTLRDALIAGINLNIFNNNADRVKMANIAQVVNVLQAVILTQGDEMVLTPTYYVFKMYKVHQDAMLIPARLTCENYELEGESIPAVSSSASVKDGVISVTLCNLNPNKEEPVELNLGTDEYRQVSAQIVTGEKMAAYNNFGKAEEVTLKEWKVKKPKNGVMNISLPSKSVVLIQLSK
ncbi:alpha-N-arabinofuranosidase [Saccharicrinis sp. FJH54]|uniref:alpha-N-arabinofuranosidase n=1 Tax=Saccharicrinis sp. FJH54 TaxID=3344665 RepID=UPI0035D52965